MQSSAVAVCASGVTSCAVTVASTGTGHVLVGTMMIRSNIAISSVSGGGTYTLGCTQWDSTGQDFVQQFWTTNSTAAATTITVNYASSTTTTTRIQVQEVSFTGTIGSPINACADNTSNSLTPPGVSLTLTGGNQYYIQQGLSGAYSSITSTINQSYTVSANNGGQLGVAYLANTTNNAAPTWNATGTAHRSVVSAVAFPETTGAPAVAIPTFSPVAGTYAGTQSITINDATAGATLCYTTDGTTPTGNGAGACTHGTTYTTAFNVASSLTVQAIGSKSGNTDSQVGSASYTINPAATPALIQTADATNPSSSGVQTCFHNAVAAGDLIFATARIGSATVTPQSVRDDQGIIYGTASPVTANANGITGATYYLGNAVGGVKCLTLLDSAAAISQMSLAEYSNFQSSRTYHTAFPLTENPISESGNWTSGSAGGSTCNPGGTSQCWADVETTAGLGAWGQEGIQTSVNFSDATALLNGTWGNDQGVAATVFSNSPPPGSCSPETELRLRSAISPGSITGYEIDYGVETSGSTNGYLLIVKWNGTQGSFNILKQLNGATCGPSGTTACGVTNGDQISATIVGSTITAYKNGIKMMSVTDSTYASGKPGVGFNFFKSSTCSVSAGPTVNNTYGYSQFNGYELSGPLDVVGASGQGIQTGGTASLASNLTTVVSNDWIIASGNASFGWSGAGSGYTSRLNVGGDIIEDEPTGAAGSYPATATLSASASNPWILQAAAFKPASSVASFIVTITAGSSTGSGSVTSNIGPINCLISGPVASGVCSATYTTGQTVVLTEAPSTGSSFSQWTSPTACNGSTALTCTVTDQETVSPTFVPNTNVNTYYVNCQTGSDSNTGSIGSPWATIQHAIESFVLSSNGAVINVQPGTCSQSTITVDKGGSSNSARLVIQCTAQWSVPSSSGCLLRGFGTGHPILLSAADFFDFGALNSFGFDIQPPDTTTVAPADAIYGSNIVASPHLQNVHIYGNYVHDFATHANGPTGAQCPSDGAISVGQHLSNGGWLINGLQIVGNRVENYTANLRTCNQAHGLYILTAGAFIANNLLINAGGPMINYYDHPCNAVIANNTVVGSNAGGVQSILLGSTGNDLCNTQLGMTSAGGNNTVINNIAVNSNSFGAGTNPAGDCSSGHPTNWTNNLLNGNAQGTSFANVTACDAISGTVAGAPVFVSGDDFHLSAGSAAINAGSTTCVTNGQTPCVPATDFDGNPRPNGGIYDIGAYEFINPGSFSLNVGVGGTGTGTITSSPAGINCPGTCGASFASGTVVTLTANPTSPSVFDGWSGGSPPCSGTGTCVLTMTLNQSGIGAAFDVPFTLTAAVSGTGTVTSSPNGISCPGTCSATFAGTISLTASPATGQRFSAWSGCSTATTPTISLTPSSATSCTANFVALSGKHGMPRTFVQY